MSRFKDSVIAADEHSRRPVRLDQLAAQCVAVFCWCNRCSHRARLDSAQLILALGPGYAVAEIGARLRCSNCGAKDVATRADLGDPLAATPALAMAV